MFLEDEFAVMRLRTGRLCRSLLVVWVVFAATSVPATFGLVTTASATAAQQNSIPVADLGNAPDRAMAAPQQEFASVKLPQTATPADQQIMRGLTALLLAMTAASGLAVWRRRVRGVIVGARRNGH